MATKQLSRDSPENFLKLPCFQTCSANQRATNFWERQDIMRIRSFDRPAVKDAHLVSVPAEAIRYALTRWDGLGRFLGDGRIELDTNPVERAIRPVALGRKNHLFAGSDGGGKRWATMASLIETCKLNGVEPHAWLSDVLQRVAKGHPESQIDQLLPWNWTPPTTAQS